jgi:VIT1/CCC1 family predicted Fe2+/Mn2+ transporter
MDLLLSLLIYFVVFGLVGYLINVAPFDNRVRQIAWFVLAVVFVIVLIRLLTGGGLIVVR